MEYTFCEPHITGGTSVVTISDKQILTFMRKMYKNNLPTDEQLIAEFCAVHWCEKNRQCEK